MSPVNTAVTINRTRVISLTFSETPLNMCRDQQVLLQPRQNVTWHSLLFRKLNHLQTLPLSTYALRSIGTASKMNILCLATMPELQPSFTRAPEQHLPCKSCVETISSTAYACKTFSIREFCIRTREIFKRGIEISTLQHKCQHSGHFAKYASIQYRSAMHAFRPRAWQSFLDFLIQH